MGSEKFKFIFLIGFCSLFSLSVFARKIQVNEPIRSELNKLLLSGNSLHTACFSQDNAKIDTGLQDIFQNMRNIQSLKNIGTARNSHLKRQLTALDEKLLLFQKSFGQQKIGFLKAIFKDLAQIAKEYQVDKYKIFFCSKDGATWMQKSWKAKNPIHPAVNGDCGRLVY